MSGTTWDTQAGQVGNITTALGADVLFLQRFTMVERMSQPFTLSCEVLSLEVVDFTAQIGTAVSVTVSGRDLVGRPFHGLLMETAQIDTANHFVKYALVLRPWFWGLSFNRNSKIFQAMSARTIIQTVFNAAGVPSENYNFAMTEAGAVVRNYCVQYDESDFSFVSRLMEEEGISYFFAHSDDGHVMTLCDGPGCHSDFTPAVPLNRSVSDTWIEPRLWSWGAQVRPAPANVAMRDFHLMRWGETLDAAKSEQVSSSVQAELFYYPGAYGHLTDDGQTTGDAFANVRLQAARAETATFVGQGDAFAIPVGGFLSVAPVSGDTVDTAAKVLVIAATYAFGPQHPNAADDAPGGPSTAISLEGVPSTTTWRPQMLTPKPVARGPQVATVVGASGQVIDPDAYGRVKVQFAWDRAGQKNEGSSCWVRVSQGWADQGFGAMHLPRVGEEVIVDFFDGDMDRPIITGRVYNSTKTPPYTLPDDKTKSTWKSQTVGDSGQYPDTVNAPDASTKGYNEIRFEDKGGSEEVWIHAQRVFNAWYRFDEIRVTGHNTSISVGYNRDITIKNNETKTVQEGDESHTISKGSLTTTISEGDETRSVSTGKRTTTIKSDESLTVSSGNLSTTVSQGDETHTVSAGKRTTEINGDDSLVVDTGNYTVDVSAGSVTISSPRSITLVVGESSIEITPSSIALVSGAITVAGEETLALSTAALTMDAEATASLSSATISIAGEAEIQIEAAIVMIN